METKKFLKRISTGRAVSPRLEGPFLRYGVVVLALLAVPVLYRAHAQETVSPHLDPDHGVMRISAPWAPRGSCSHCHDQHALETGEAPYPAALFAENSNTLCYTADGTGPCHQDMPSNYPATETMRIPDGFPNAGYFEYNSGGAKIYGVKYRARWPGAIVYDDAGMVGGFHYFSPHRNDPDMPELDPAGRGACRNCHNVHGSQNPFDMLTSTYLGTGGYEDPTYPSRYQLCFDCHSTFGPPGMELSGRSIQDYYDSSINADQSAGHMINMNPEIALSWPSHIRPGDKLSCSDCHNAHGSRGFNGQGPNAYLISDERPGWYGLTDTKTDPLQSRRFCLGCHIPSNGVPGSQIVAGIVMNTLPNEQGHAENNPMGCVECHGADYSSSTSYNVHHPNNDP